MVKVDMCSNCVNNSTLCNLWLVKKQLQVKASCFLTNHKLPSLVTNYTTYQTVGDIWSTFYIQRVFFFMLSTVRNLIWRLFLCATWQRRETCYVTGCHFKPSSVCVTDRLYIKHKTPGQHRPNTYSVFDRFRIRSMAKTCRAAIFLATFRLHFDGL